MIRAAQSLGDDLCEALGLDGRLVTSITIRIQPNSLPLVRVTQAIYDEQAQALVSVVKRYTLAVKSGMPGAK